MDRTAYQPFVDADEHDHDNPPHDLDHEVMVHVVPEANKLRWNHIEDLDSFFTRVYYYHQKHGFWCIVIQEIFELLQFAFVVGFATFLMECVSYPVLFKDKIVNPTDPNAKVTLSDALVPPGQCIAGFGGLMWCTLFVALSFWIVRFIFVSYNIVLNLEIRAFYRSALCILDPEIDNLTWHDVQKRLREVQREQQMCIHKPDLTELDIYHRILRFKNYLIAMTNKNLLPLKYSLPFIGDVVYLTHGMKKNLELLLFWGPWAPFENSWHLREDYKKVVKRKELASALRQRIALVALLNLVLSPVIFLWQILYSFFNYAEVVKREPGALGMRRWSIYGRLYLRHFNELEHEINARLSRAYRPAAKYMSIFNSPLLTILAQNLAFISGSIVAVLSLLAVWDEDVVTIEHVLFIITICGAIVAVSRAFIPDEQLVWCPERLLTAVLANVHYLPDQWKGQAHTSRTRDEFSLLFQYKAVYLVEELLSPFITPIILYCYLRPKALDIVDFYRNFTVDVIGVGDVCSFAQMDVRKHGNPTWSSSVYGSMDGGGGNDSFDGNSGNGNNNNNNTNPYTQAENGKTELSLVHFTHTNPEWVPQSESSTHYITNLKERAAREASILPTVLEENPFYASLNSISSLGNEYNDVISSIIRDNNLMNGSGFGGYQEHQEEESMGQGQGQPTSQTQSLSFPYGYAPSQSQQPSSFRGQLNKHEGPLQQRSMMTRGIVAGIQSHAQNQRSGFYQQQQSQFPSYNNSAAVSFAQSFAQYPPNAVASRPFGGAGANEINHTIELGAVDMSLDALYLHNIHHQEIRKRASSYRNPTIFSTSSNIRAPMVQVPAPPPAPREQELIQLPQIHSQPHVAISTSSSSGDSLNNYFAG